VLKEAGNRSQVRTENAELSDCVNFISSPNARLANVIKRFLMDSRLAAVGNGLVERLEVFERWLIAFVRCCAKVFVNPPMRGAPGSGLLLAHTPGEVFPKQRMSVENDEFAGTFGAVYRQQLRVFQSL